MPYTINPMIANQVNKKIISVGWRSPVASVQMEQQACAYGDLISSLKPDSSELFPIPFPIRLENPAPARNEVLPQPRVSTILVGIHRFGIAPQWHSFPHEIRTRVPALRSS
mmetsp:Transcript_5534/g.11309  ORF Transcript_5534/g.11309 Transcript_5534/m.11309 type:complete len:111 (+) Transcript_5534:15-347(+)